RRGPRVLVAPGAGGFHVGALLESSLAVALTLRGAEAEVLLCDSALPGCQLTEIETASPQSLSTAPPQPRCAKCEKRGRGVFGALELKLHWIGHLLNEQKKAEASEVSRSLSPDRIGDFELNGLAVGEHAVAGALRYFARGDFEGEPHAEQIVRAYLRAALWTVFAVEELLDRSTYEVACFNHGIYVPQGLIGEVCRKRGVRVVNWNPAYRKSSFIFSHGDSYHHTMISEPVSSWEDIAWSDVLERETMEYLQSRRAGTQDWIWFHAEPEEEAEKIARAIGTSFSRPTIALLTNVMWDAQLHYRSNAFPSMLAWVQETIRYFERRPELQLVIRVHPAELRGGIPSRQLMALEIRKAFPRLPPNVFVVGPESQVSTYGLVEQCNAAIIYNTKTGMEISSLGIPVIVAGEAWIRGKGFSLDASSPDDYFRILDRLPLSGPLSADQLRRARKYAYHFFFRRMIPVPFIEQSEKGGPFKLSCGSLKDLLPGRLKGLDV
ncbi:MAG: capsule biosynthesis protein, partial [Cyanobacteria bacterium 13_1_40CM_2_61_4]